MRAIKIEDRDGQTEITVEHRLVFGLVKWRVAYRTAGRMVDEYYHWVKLPGKTLVPDHMSFQLDSWKKNGI